VQCSLQPRRCAQLGRGFHLTPTEQSGSFTGSVLVAPNRDRGLSMRRRVFLCGLLVACSTFCAGIRCSPAWELVTRNEIKRESTARHNRADPGTAAGAPIITLEEPNLSQRITPPVTLRMTFRPQVGATINPRTFRATYGRLGIDITHHIVAHAKLTASGLVANNASVPAGSYRVTLQIADNRHRVGRRTFEFTVHRR
jgi:hypothetical protein